MCGCQPNTAACFHRVRNLATNRIFLASAGRVVRFMGDLTRTFSALLWLWGTSVAFDQSPGTIFKDCEVCPELIVIPAGTFVMGVPRGEEERHGVAEVSRHRSEPMTEITLARNFAIGRFHVTRGQFAAFVAETKYELPDNRGCWDFYGTPAATTSNARRAMGRPDVQPTLNWRSPGFEQDDRHPVVCVSWVDIRAYLSWLTRKTGFVYRLPSEAEWEYVARDRTDTARPWGDDNESSCKYANVSDLSRVKAHGMDPSPNNLFQCDDGFPATSPVGSFPPNGFGAYDMFGNVWQVTEDCFEYSLDNIPRDGSALVSNTSIERDKNHRVSDPTVPPRDICDLRGVRGGSFDIFPWFVRSGYRSRFETFRPDSGFVRLSYEGFRVARSLR
jgi:formylglycine-generating enzyme required for sulfatase activity